MDVPEPSTVIFSGAWGMLRLLKLVRTPGQIGLSKDRVRPKGASF
jgi:hypothetical protein